MADVVEQQTDPWSEIDWGEFFDSVRDSGDLFSDDLFLSEGLPPAVETPGSFQSSTSPEFGDIEQFLLEDGSELGEAEEGINEYMSGFLLDSPEVVCSDARVSDDNVPGTDSNKEQNEEIRSVGDRLPSGESDDVEEKEEMEKGDTSDAADGGEDGMSKKRKRQLRNRDSAMRSRERKKLHVRDLEMKSKFMEGECRRLEYTLRCIMAENQILRHQLQTFGASGPKQESAALPLESLLLGSLFWLLSIVFLLHPLANKVSGLRTRKRDLEIVVAVRDAGSSEKEVDWKLAPYPPLGRRLWKALRRKMKVSHLISFLIEFFYFGFGRWRNVNIY